MFQELDNFNEFSFGFLDTSHVIEGDAGVFFDHHLGFTFAHVHHAAHTAELASEPTHDQHPQADKDQRWHEP